MVQAIALTSLGETFRALRRPAAGRDHLEAAITAWQRVGDRKNEGETQVKLGDLLSGIGEDQAAHENWRAARAIFEKLGDPQAHVLRRRHGI
jgi:hypothetical protein